MHKKGRFLRQTPADTTFDPECLLPQVESPFPLRPARNPPKSGFLRWLWKTLTLQRWRKNKPGSNQTKRKRNTYVDNVESQIPLEICLVLSNYSACEYIPCRSTILWLYFVDLMRNNLVQVQPSVASGMITTLALFQDTVLHLERICNTPLPFAYQFHLRLALWFVFYSMFHCTLYWPRMQDIPFPITSKSPPPSSIVLVLRGILVPNLYRLRVLHDSCYGFYFICVSQVLGNRPGDVSLFRLLPISTSISDEPNFSAKIHSITITMI